MTTTPPGDLTVWSGWDPRAGVEPDDARTALATRPRRPGEERYQLTAVAARGFRPPTFLTRAEVEAVTPSPEAGAPPSDDGADTSIRSVWSLVYRPLVPTDLPVEPFAIYLLGVNPPAGIGDDELREFEHFYVDVHVREVAERRRALRAVPHRLVDVVKAPHRGAPTFLTAYELDEQSASVRRHTGPPYRSGPEVWQRHSTPWRLWYRRLPADG